MSALRTVRSWEARRYRGSRPRPRLVPTVLEALEDRCVPSTLAGHHPAGHHLAASAFIGSVQVHEPGVIHTATSGGGTIHAQVAFQAWWTYPSNGQGLGGGPGFIAIGFSQPLDWSTVNGANIQLAHQNSNGSWALMPIGVWPNPGDGSVEIAPLSAQPNGLYAVAVYPGLHSSSGASLGSPYYFTFTIDNRFYAPGGPNPVTVQAPGNGQVLGLFPGVITADQFTPLQRSSVNANTVQLFQLNSNGSQTFVPSTVHYDPETPTIELVPTVPLFAGNYRFVINGVRDLAGDPQVSPYSSTFTVTQDPTHYPDSLQGQAIDVANVYPPPNLYPSVTSVDTITFTQNANASSINANTIQLVRWLPDQNRWSAPLPISLTYNAYEHTVYLVSEQGLPQGNYLISVNPHPGQSGIIGQNGLPMASSEYFHYGLFYSSPPLDGRIFSPYPGNGVTVNGDPAAILVYLQKYAGEIPSSINNSTVQLRPWLGNGVGNPLPIAVAYNPWPGLVVITPFVSLGDGPYVISVNGLVDIAGNPQQYGFSSWFAVSNTGRPQTTS